MIDDQTDVTVPPPPPTMPGAASNDLDGRTADELAFLRSLDTTPPAISATPLDGKPAAGAFLSAMVQIAEQGLEAQALELLGPLLDRADYRFERVTDGKRFALVAPHQIAAADGEKIHVGDGWLETGAFRDRK